MQKICQVCGSENWLDLPDPAPGRSVTTAGRILEEGLGKAQCAQCGFVQRIHAEFLALTDYYQQDYANYYDRPGTLQFHTARYRVLAEWMDSVLQPWAPRRILDVGCGQGWAMEAMQSLHPQSGIEGLDPSHDNIQVARKKGFKGYEGTLGGVSLPVRSYDLVYCNNVIQHVANAREFLVFLKETIREDGVILVSCPDGSIPNIEILWSDQNFSFLPVHLMNLSKEVGFASIDFFPSPPSPSVPPAQMFLLSKERGRTKWREGTAPPAPDREEIFRRKCRYLESFRTMDESFASQLEKYTRVFNFGASYWSSILAAYCPNYWNKVSACVVDDSEGPDTRFLDKPVWPLNSIEPSNDQAIVLGTSPSTHPGLRARFSASWNTIISWDHFIDY